jgi:hypothetical protein
LTEQSKLTRLEHQIGIWCSRPRQRPDDLPTEPYRLLRRSDETVRSVERSRHP